MNFISQIFRGPPALDIPSTISQTLIRLKLGSLQPLPQYYIEILIESLQKKAKPQLALKQLILQMESAVSAPALIKILTIVFQLLRRENYSQPFLEQIEETQVKYSKKFESSQNKWVRDLNISCISFLGRLSSCGDVLKRAECSNKGQIQDSTLSIDLLRMTNLYSLLFPNLNIAMNTAGRYYKKTYLFFDQFYSVFRALLVTGYQYMKYICDKFMQSYNTISNELIELFDKVIPEVQLLCDSMQEFITSKYYKGKGMSKKVYFSDDKIQELSYHLMTQKRQKMDKEQEQLDTADSEYFFKAQKEQSL